MEGRHALHGLGRPREADDIFAQFINKHYELYGRQLKVDEFFSPSADSTASNRSLDAVGLWPSVAESSPRPSCE